MQGGDQGDPAEPAFADERREGRFAQPVRQFLIPGPALAQPLERAEAGRPTQMFLTKEAVRLALEGVAVGVACTDCPSLPDLLARYERAGGRLMVCPVCFNAKQLDKGTLLPNAELSGTVQLWEWIGDEAATTFSY